MIDRRSLAAGLAVAAVAAFTLDAPAIPVTLYANLNGTGYHDNVLRLPIVPFMAGLLAAVILAMPRRSDATDLVRGVTLGAIAILGLGLVRAVGIVFGDPYFTLPYRLYATAFLGVAAAGASFFAARALRDRRNDVEVLAWTVVGLVLIGAASAAVSRQLVPAATILVAAAAGAVAAATGRVRIRPISERAAVIGVTVAALAFRAIFGLQALMRTGPGAAFAAASDDGPQYFDHASNMYRDPGTIPAVLAANDGFPPAYSMFLALTMKATGGSLILAVVLQALAAGAAALLLYLIARRVAGHFPALIATLLFATEQSMIQVSSTLTPESILIPTVLLGLWALVRYRDTSDVRWMIVVAVTGGLAFVSRNNVGAAFIVAAVLWLALVHGPRPRLVRDVAMIALSFVLFVTPIAVATTRIDGVMRITNQIAAVPYEIDADDGITIENDFLIDRGIHPFRELGPSLQRFIADPFPPVGFMLSAAPQRLQTLLFFIPSGVADPRNIVSPAQLPNPYGQLLELILVAGLVVAVTLLAVRRPWIRRPEILFLLAFTAFYVAMFVFAFPPRHAVRYRVPVQPIVFIAEGVGVVFLLAAAVRAWTARAPLRVGHRQEHAAPAVEMLHAPPRRGEL